MKVVMRADAGPIIGTGHLMRCAALAQRLIRRGAQVHLIGDIGSASLALPPRRAGYPGPSDPLAELTRMWCVRRLCWRSAPVDLLIVDHYELGLAWRRPCARWSDAWACSMIWGGSMTVRS